MPCLPTRFQVAGLIMLWGDERLVGNIVWIYTTRLAKKFLVVGQIPQGKMYQKSWPWPTNRLNSVSLIKYLFHKPAPDLYLVDCHQEVARASKCCIITYYIILPGVGRSPKLPNPGFEFCVIIIPQWQGLNSRVSFKKHLKIGLPKELEVTRVQRSLELVDKLPIRRSTSPRSKQKNSTNKSEHRTEKRMGGCVGINRRRGKLVWRFYIHHPLGM